MRVIVCGGRDFCDGPYIFETLDRLDLELCIEGVIEGGQRTYDKRGRIIGGADYWAMRWARARGIPFSSEPAEWRRWGKAAGNIRNGEMLRKWRPTTVIGFPGGTGTADMLDQARRAGLHPIEIPLPLRAAA